MLTPYFRDITFLHWSDLVPMAKAGQTPSEYDRIIIESVERGFAERTVETFPNPVVENAILGWLKG